MLYGNPDSICYQDRRFSSDTRTFLRNASGYVNRNLFNRKDSSKDDVSIQNGTTLMTGTTTSRSTRSEQSNGNGVDTPVICIESNL